VRRRPYPTLLVLVLLSACAGPMTPFGALHSLRSLPLIGALADLESPARIRFFPEHQVLHDSQRLTLRVDDPEGIPERYSVQILYNNRDVTSQFMKRARKSIDASGRRLDIDSRSFRLRASSKNNIELRYFREGKAHAKATYGAPECDPFESMTVHHTDPYLKGGALLPLIDKAARHRKMNPAFFAALIAQESSFNPKAVSWSKALGLTQVTPVADLELQRLHAEWPRNSLVESSTPQTLKALVLSGYLDGQSDWRLDPGLSIEGGLSYVSILESYWKREETTQLLAETFAEPEKALHDVLIASYNWGPSRVLRAVKDYGADYLDSPELEHSRRYVGRIKSFCEHFAQEDISHEDPS
jgi:soluble lytic murein transglycosylase-like protein